MKKHYPRRILFDGILLQTFPMGSAAYTYKVFCTLYEKIINCDLPVEICVLYDSRQTFVGEYDIELYLGKNVTLIDISLHESIADIISKYQIDSFFVGCGRFYSRFNLENIHCHSVVVIHDLFDCEINANRLMDFVSDSNLYTWKSHVWLLISAVLRVFGIRMSYIRSDYQKIIRFYSQDNVEAVTVSNYSYYAFRYFFPQMTKSIHVLYSPHKVIDLKNDITDKVVKDLVMSKRKYYLMVSTNRPLKNARFVIDTFLQMQRKDIYLVTVGYPRILGANHIICGYLSESDLEHLYRHAYALIYPSLEEGFGYPPIEAMRCGIPVLASNVCSMPEICGDAALYFSPIHHNSLYIQLIKLDDVHEQYVKKSKERYLYIKQRQEEDLDKLINLILSQE